MGDDDNVQTKRRNQTRRSRTRHGNRRQNDTVSTQSVPETAANNPTPILPDEIISEILVRVPVRSLLQFRCVCKSWKTLISDPHFAKNQLQLSTEYPQLFSHYFSRVQWKIISYDVESLLENQSIRSNPIEPYTFTMMQNYQVIGSCNGLLCLYDLRQCYVVLWNPCLNLKSKRSPTTMNLYGDFENISYHGFGYDQENDKYKVLLTVYNFMKYGKSVALIFTSGAKSWKKIKNLPCDLDNFRFDACSGRFVSGTLNWIVKKYINSDEEAIISFDVKNETYGEVLLPQLDGDNISNLMLDVVSNCLCLCFDYKETESVVWVMKEYGVAESWTKLIIIPHMTFTSRRRWNVTMWPIFIDTSFPSEIGAVLVNTMRSKLVLYNICKDRTRHPKISSMILIDELQIYHESLITPRW
ncbi:F-box/kelch-repeat protein At3g23880-like [Cicer arietinum]|uniref:F-box/kelch-repeat protein At3g23880-like n=1 Tax=Cicer arietinum TaxID=3827 RepID=A0A1S2XYA9_CICAR|nr:F-box/kelch-repeat protein At3g23880-like [Cicer arietinum]